MTLASYIIAADNHNIGNTQTSWLDIDSWGTKFGNMGKFAATSILSGANSFYNSGAMIGSWLGIDAEQNDTTRWISSIDSDLGIYYRQNKESVDLAGFVLGSIIPGVGGVKIFNAGQAALRVAAETGKIGGNLSRATGLLVPNTQKYVDLAAKEINSSLAATKLLNVNTTRALAAGVWQNTLEAAAFETVVQATMFKSPVLEQQDVGDIVSNIAVGGVLGGVIGGSFQAAKSFGFLKKAVKEEDTLRFPFISRPAFAEATSKDEKIIQLAWDTDTAAVPVVLRNADGTEVFNNYAVTKKLYEDKVRKNNNEIRLSINEMADGDFELGNILANTSHGSSAQTYFENFSGALHISRPTAVTKAEAAVSKAIKNGEPPDRIIAGRFIKLIGDDTGRVLADMPTVLSIGDLYRGEKAIVDYVKGYKFDQKSTWSALDLKGSTPHLDAEARYIWASRLEELKVEQINKYDIPLLERAYKDGRFDIPIVSGEGPTLEVVTPTSKADLWRIIKEAKEEAAVDLLPRLGVDTETIAKIVNVKQSYLEGTVKNEFEDLLAHQTDHASYLKSLQDKGLSDQAKEAIDPMYLPKWGKVIYDVGDDLTVTTPNVVDGIVALKQQQKLYEEGAKRVTAKILGSLSQSLPDLPDRVLASASRNGSGAGLFSSENSNYGTLGSSVAWIGSITRSAKERLRKEVSERLQTPLIKLGEKPQAALEFEAINQKISRSPEQFVLYEFSDDYPAVLLNRKYVSAFDDGSMVIDDLAEGVDFHHIKHPETRAAIEAHIDASGRTTQAFKEIRAQQGKTDNKLPDVFRPIRPDLKQYPYFAFVKDPRVTGAGHTTMIHAASEKELAALIDRVPSQYKVIHKTETEEYFRARGEYEYQRTLHENYIDSDLASRGIFSNFFPKSDPQKIIDDVLGQHLRQTDVLVQETVRLRYESQFNWLEDLGKQYSKTDTSKFASRAEAIERSSNNPYFNYIKTALDISKINEHPLIYGFGKLLDESVSKAVGAVKNTFFTKVKTPADLELMNKQLDEHGLKPAYYDSALHVLANHTAPRGELTKFVRSANSLLSLFTLGLDPLNSLNNAIGSTILRGTELKHLTRAIANGNSEVAGELAALSRITTPGTGDSILAPSKLVAQAIKNFWDDKGTLLAKYKDAGYIKDRVEQLKLLVDDFTLKGTESVADLNSRVAKGLDKARGLAEAGEKATGNKLAEEFNRFISANVMDQITSVAIKNGLMDEATAKAYINTFVNRVEGNIIASQRPLIFQGPIGQAISLFQSYQFNLLQQLFRYVAEGSKKDLGMLFGLQSTMYGLQALPGFQFINTHIVGQLSGNTEHRDLYDSTYGTVGRTAGNWILYGAPSNILHTNIYSRGDINPRQITILPSSLQEIPIVAGWGKFLLSLKETAGKIAGGGNVWESILQGVEHNGISRPLAGFAQVLQGIPGGVVYSTSNRGSILYSNDLLHLSNLSRLAGGRPLDEAIVNDAMFRVKKYEAARRNDMLGLAETVKTTLIQDEKASEEQLAKFAQKYAELGGKQAGFNKWMMQLYKSSNVSQAQQLESSLKNPFAYKMQLLMGGDDE